jgi:hypothetical protein
MHIIMIDLIMARNKYHEILNELGKNYLYGAPDIQHFLSPANYSLFPKQLEVSYQDDHEYALSKTGEARYNALFSPHARTLVATILIRRLNEKTSNGQLEKILPS